MKRLIIPALILAAIVVIWLATYLRAPQPDPDPMSEFWNRWEIKGQYIDTPEGKVYVQENWPTEAPRRPKKRTAASGS
jgi:hypothetical protein